MMRNRLLLLVGLLCFVQVAFATSWTSNGFLGIGKKFDDSWYNSSDTEFKISTAAQLAGLARRTNDNNVNFAGKTIILTADVDMGANEWPSINNFQGTFDGNGHVIKNLKYDNSTVCSGLFRTVSGATIKNVIVTGSVRNHSTTVGGGGIAAVLKGNGIVENCAYLGSLTASAPNVVLGGIVGNIEEGIVRGSYFNGTFSIADNREGVVYGNVAGKSNGEIINCYYVQNQDYLIGVGELGEEAEGEGIPKDSEAFITGEVAWLFNQINPQLWSQGTNYPVFADKDNGPTYRISYPEVSNGIVSGPLYANQGTTVSIIITPEEGYMYENLEVTDAEIFNEDMFIMPEMDVLVTCNIIPYPKDRIIAFKPNLEEITPNTFIAKWNEVENATDYLVTVKTGGEILQSYDAKSAGDVTSLKIKALYSNTTYSFTVQTVIGDVISEPSNEIIVTTSEYSLDNPVTWMDGARNKLAYDDTWFNKLESEFTITTSEELGGLAKKVNTDEEDFLGKTIFLEADLDMSEYYWVSIENFKGKFFGNGHTISNLRTNQTSKGLFATVEGGEINKLFVSGKAEELQDKDKVVGGIIGLLKDGLLVNSAYVGTIELTSEETVGGGLVGKNEGGVISNSFFYGENIIADGAVWGGIVGISNQIVTNSYYVYDPVEDDNDGEEDGDEEGSMVGVKRRTALRSNLNQEYITGEPKTSEEFASGEVAWLLNQYNGNHSGIWAQSSIYPIYTSEDNPTIYRVHYPELENGKIESEVYVIAGTAITLTVIPDEGYMYENLAVSDVELTNTTFVMPANDVYVTCDILPLPVDITALPAEQITHNSFLAKWNKVENATNYLITVREGEEEENILEAYNDLPTGNVTEMKIEGLSAETTYYYSLKAVVGGEESEASNWRRVFTTSNQLDIVSLEKFSFVVQWNNIEGATGYILVLTKGDQVLETVELNENSYKFEELLPQTAYQLNFTIVYEDREEEWSPVTVQTSGDYGQQLNNSGFEYWEGSGRSREPVSWNSFMTASGDAAGTAQLLGAHMEESSEVRPGTYGSSSVRIWTYDALFAKANGNLTCGRINAGEADTSSYDNYNISLIDDPDFSEEMNGFTPDSLSVWVKYVPKGTSDVYRARIAATIHDTYNYRDPAPKDATENDSHIVAKAVLDYAATEDKGWQRISIPFDYKVGPATSADYMLVTFTSNKVAGAGSGDDEVYIDDIVLIYNPTLELDANNSTVFSRGSEINIAYTLEGTMSATNILSDKNTVSLQLMKEGTESMTIAELISGTYNGLLDVDSEEVDGEEGEENEEGVVEEPQSLPQVIVITATDEEEITLQINDFTLSLEGETIPVGNIILTEVPVKQQGGEYSFAVATTLDLDVLSELPVEVKGKINVQGVLSLSLSVGEMKDLTFKNGISENGHIKTLATITTDNSGVLTGMIPSDFEIGSYKARVVTTNYPMVSELFTVEVGPTALVALEADEIEETSFVARWNEATDENIVYLLTVKSYGNIVEGYENLEVSNQTTWLVENLEPGRAYTYTVKAKINNYVSIDSNEIQVRTLGENPVPEPVSTLEPDNVTAHSFVAKWEESDFENITEYLLTVKQGEEILPGYEAISTELETSWEVTGLQPETAYSYFVVVRSGEYYSQESGEMLVTTPIYVPASVEVLEAENIEIRSFTAKWEQAEDVTEYLLTVKQGANVILNGISTGLNTSYEVTGLQPNTQYTYSVVVKVDKYLSGESEVITVNTKEFIPAKVVVLEADNVGTHSFTAKWRASELDDVTEYLLTVRKGDEVIYDAVSTELNTSYEVTDLQPNTQYTYSVVVRVEELYYSDKSDDISVTTHRFIPAKVNALAPLIVTDNSFMARWEVSEEATDYLLTVKQNGTVLNTYYTGSATVQFVDGLEAGTKYTYIVQVVADDEMSEESNEITVTTTGGLGIDAENVSQFTVYPSPARDYLYVNGSKEDSLYYISTLTGAVVKTGTLLTGEIDVKDLIQGVYFIQIDGVKAKFIKE